MCALPPYYPVLLLAASLSTASSWPFVSCQAIISLCSCPLNSLNLSTSYPAAMAASTSTNANPSVAPLLFVRIENISFPLHLTSKSSLSVCDSRRSWAGDARGYPVELIEVIHVQRRDVPQEEIPVRVLRVVSTVL